MRYMATLANPFQAEPGACVPCDLFPLPSQKIRVFSRGTFQLGTTGFGFIVAAPMSIKDGGACTFTTSTSVLASNQAFSAATNTGSAQFLQLPYALADLGGTSVQARVVALGLRVRYAGAESTRSGTVVCYEDQDHQGIIASGATFLSLQQYPSATVARPSGDGTWDGEVCSSGPCTPPELEFVSLAYPNVPSGVSQTLANSGYLAIGIKGNAADSYDFELFEHIEYIGTSVTAKTPSNADTDQYGKIIQASKEISNVRPLTPELAPSLFERFAAKVSESLPQLIGMGMGAARAVAGDPTGYAQLLGGAAGMIMNTPLSSQPRLLRGQTQLMKQLTA